MLLEKGKKYREGNVQKGKYHCDVCNHSFGYKKDLKKHPNTYMNSID